MNDNPAVSASERLALSRQAIVRQMNHESATTTPSDDAARPEIDASASTLNLGRQVVSAWWHNHPAHLALDLAKPVLSSYAEHQPIKLLGIAAGLGAAVVLLRPWRLMTLTGVLGAAVKSPQLSGMVRSLLFGAGPTRPR